MIKLKFGKMVLEGNFVLILKILNRWLDSIHLWLTFFLSFDVKNAWAEKVNKFVRRKIVCNKKIVSQK